MVLTFHLDFNPHDVEHRRVADWLAKQYDPAEAIVRLVRAAGEGRRRMLQWEELATLLANDMREVRTQIAGRPPEKRPQPETRENPESARRLDSMLG